MTKKAARMQRFSKIIFIVSFHLISFDIIKGQESNQPLSRTDLRLVSLIFFGPYNYEQFRNRDNEIKAINYYAEYYDLIAKTSKSPNFYQKVALQQSAELNKLFPKKISGKMHPGCKAKRSIKNFGIFLRRNALKLAKKHFLDEIKLAKENNLIHR